MLFRLQAEASNNGLKVLVRAKLGMGGLLKQAEGLFPFNSEILVRSRILILYVLQDDLIRYVAATATEIAPCPDMSTPKSFSQMGKLLQQLGGRVPFHLLHQPTDRYLRWNRDKQMHVILRDVPLHNRDLGAPTNLAGQLSNTGRALSCSP